MSPSSSSPPSPPPPKSHTSSPSTESLISDESKRSKLSPPQSPPFPLYPSSSSLSLPYPPSSPPPSFDESLGYRGSGANDDVKYFQRRQSPSSLYSSNASSNASLATSSQASSSSATSLSMVQIPSLSLKKGLSHSFEESFEWTLDHEQILKPQFKFISSPLFTMGPYKWSLFSSPNASDTDFISVYLKAMDAEEVSGTENWSICCQFNLSFLLISTDVSFGVEVDGSLDHQQQQQQQSFMSVPATQTYEEGKLLFSKEFSHRFDRHERDWGRPSFYSRKLMLELRDSSPPGTKFLITCSMRLINDESGILWHNFVNYDSKSITGYVGLANQGATCYMNSLLQSLYLTPAFLRSIYQIPTENLANPQENSALALQRLFWKMQFENDPVSTRELTRAFGWDSMTSFLQSDVQEFCRLLFENLEDQMKKTPAEGSIEKIFVGKVRNVISCLNVDYRSTRTENFYDLQVAVRGCERLEDSFKLYCQEEMMVGDNQYRADGHGLQDAKKFIEFESFPPVMHLQLERYAFCPNVMNTVKINDRLEFPLNIDITHCLAPDSPQRPENGSQGPCSYTLQSVFVHSGDSHGGHYYVFVRDLCPTSPNQGKWCRFDDTTVTPATQTQAVEDNFGGTDTALPSTVASSLSTPLRLSREERAKKFTNAYMLIYVKDSEISTIMKVIDPSLDIPAHIGNLLKKERERERRRRIRRDDALRSVTIGVLTNSNLANYGGFDYFNFRNPNLPLTLDNCASVANSFCATTEGSGESNCANLYHSVSRDTILGAWKAELAKKLNITNPSLLVLRPFSLRRNQTIRMDVPFSEDNEKILTMGQVHSESLKNLGYSRYSSKKQRESHPALLYADLVTDVSLLYEPSIISILCKFYDPDHDSLTPLGLINVKFSDTLLDKEALLCDMIGLPPVRRGSPIDSSSGAGGGSGTSTATVRASESQLLYWEEVKPGKIQPLNPESTFKVLGYRYGDILTFQLSKPLILLSDSADLSGSYSSDTLIDCNNGNASGKGNGGDEDSVNVLKKLQQAKWARDLPRKVLLNKSSYVLGKKVSDYYKGIMNCILVKLCLPKRTPLPLQGNPVGEWEEVAVRLSLDSDWNTFVRMVAERLLLNPLDPPSNVQCVKLASYLRLSLIIAPAPTPTGGNGIGLRGARMSSIDSDDTDSEGEDNVSTNDHLTATSFNGDFDESRLIPLKAIHDGSQQHPLSLKDVLSRCNRELFDVNNANPRSSIEVLAQRSDIPIVELDRKNRIRLLLIKNPLPSLKSSPFVDDLVDGSVSNGSVDGSDDTAAITTVEKKWMNVGMMDTINSLKNEGKFDFLKYQKDSLIRMVEVYHSKLVREYLLDDSLSSLSLGLDSLNPGYNYYLEEVKSGSEEYSYYTSSTSQILMITVFSYWKDLSRPHSLPFRFSIIDNESMVSFLKRLLKRMAVNEEFGTCGEDGEDAYYKIVRDQEWTFNLTSVGKVMEFATYKTLRKASSTPIMIGEETLHHVLKEYEDTVEIGINRPDPSLEQRGANGVGNGGVGGGSGGINERSIKMRSSSSTTLKG